MEFDLREVGAGESEAIQLIGALRVEAWKSWFPSISSQTTCLDKFDGSARHWAVFDDAKPIAAARMSVHHNFDDIPDRTSYDGVFNHNSIPLPVGSLNRLVVHPRYRGLGLSKKLDIVRLRAAEEMGCMCIVIATFTGERRVRSLEALGFKVAGMGPPDSTWPIAVAPPSVVLIKRVYAHF